MPAGVGLDLKGGTSISYSASAPRAITVDIPEIGQAAVLLGRVGPSRLSPDYVDTLVANAVLGVGYSSRLNSEIRIKRGLSYGAGSSLAARKQPAPITGSAQTRNDAVAQVVDLLGSEFSRLGQEPIAEAELARPGAHAGRSAGSTPARAPGTALRRASGPGGRLCPQGTALRTALA